MFKYHDNPQIHVKYTIFINYIISSYVWFLTPLE